MKQNEMHYCNEKTPDKLYRIGMFAGMNHVTVKTLRYYDEEGLLRPASIDPESGYRYYTLSQMEVLHQILALKDMGLKIDEIREILNGADERELLKRKKTQIMLQIANLTSHLAQVEQALAEPEKTYTSHVLVKALPEVDVAYIRRRINSYDELFDIMPEMGKEMKQLGCECAIPEYCFNIYPEPGYKEEHILIEACEAVKECKENTDKLQFKNIPAVSKAACIFHKGSYGNLPDSYAAVLRYIEEHSYTICGPIRESYIDGVWNKDKTEDWLTEIQIPVCREGEEHE